MNSVVDQKTFDSTRFRRVLGHFCSGVTIITARAEAGPVGMTCQSFVSLSLDPPLIAFSSSRQSTSLPHIVDAGAFCVNVLSEDQEELCLTFAKKGQDRWLGVPWSPGNTGSPRLSGVQAWIECRIEVIHDTGDHLLVIGRVIDLAEYDRRPLLFYQGEFRTFDS